jgi:peptide/nickel transport system permease protein
VAIGIFNIPVFARITRGAANAVWAREYVLAARAAGKGPWRITLDHVLPNIASVLIVQATISVRHRHPGRGGAELPGPGHAAAAAQLGPHAQRGADADVPGAACWRLPRRGHRAGVLGLNLMGDGLRDLLDPKLARRR